MPVIAVRHGRDVVPPGDQGCPEPDPVDRAILGRQPSDPGFDHPVGDPALEHPGHRIPGRPLEIGQQPPIEVAAIPSGTDDRRIFRAKVDQLRNLDSHQAEQQPIETDEGLVAVAGNGKPVIPGLVPKQGPPPLIAMAVPVAEKDIGEPGQEKLPGVDPNLGPIVEPFEEVRGPDDLLGAGERHPLVVGIAGAVLEQAKDLAELGPILA